MPVALHAPLSILLASVVRELGGRPPVMVEPLPHELGRSRDQAKAEHAGRRRRCPVCQPAGEAVA